MEKMVRHASDNKYLHRDFHGILNLGIEYLQEQYGDDAVIEYLQEYTRVFHKPLIDAVKADGLSAIQKYFERIFEIEEVEEDILFEMGVDTLTIVISKCPALSHMKKTNITPAAMFIETTRTIGLTLAEETGLSYELVTYDEATGASIQKFIGKADK
ncbi:MAG: hypothetical protein HN948_06295 [Clostridia bacterium]|jgi:hypothetical protein|nr:hypothetical protein [Clostridia bacterium]MBT7122607.1 hypothetical protein [Clostridia bacterium]